MEVMIVLALLLALASVVVPIAVTQARAGRVADAGLQLEAALAMARADAQRQSTPVRVLARTLRSGEVEVFAETITLGVPDRETDGPTWGDATSEKRPGDGGTSERPAATLTLPKGVVVSDRRDEPADGRGAGATPGFDGSAAQATGTPESQGVSREDSSDGTADGAGSALLLAVFLPDGEVVGPGPRFLLDGRGGLAEIRVDSLSGRVRVVSVPRAALGAVVDGGAGVGVGGGTEGGGGVGGAR